MVVLLRDDQTNSLGSASVSNRSGSVALDSERQATRVLSNQPPVLIDTLSDTEVAEVFGAALSVLPPPPLRFTLHFRFESSELTDEARAPVPGILEVVRERPVPDITVAGHTDTTGALDWNFELEIKRAREVRDLLVSAGFDPASIAVSSHGERTLLIQTAEETPEPLNRRVEVVVR